MSEATLLAAWQELAAGYRELLARLQAGESVAEADLAAMAERLAALPSLQPEAATAALGEAITAAHAAAADCTATLRERADQLRRAAAGQARYRNALQAYAPRQAATARYLDRRK